jgi:Ran GTPase-activating protein (RanGAP) involved in mRNA processing and transport
MKYKLNINEIRSYNHSIIIETNLNEDKMDEILNQIERGHKLIDSDDYLDRLEQKDEFTVVEYSQDIDGSSDRIECDDLEEIG